MNKLKMLIWLGFFLYMISSGSALADCGDVNCSGGVPDMDDITDLINYLYDDYDSLCDLTQAEVDGLPGITNNDLVSLIEFLFDLRLPITCRTPGDTVPPVYNDSLFFRTAAVLPGRSTGKIEVWRKNESELTAYEIPFHFSCVSAEVVLDSVYFVSSDHLIAADKLLYRDAKMVMHLNDFSPERHFPPGERKIADLYFTVLPDNYLREIQIDTVYNGIGQGLIYTGISDNHLYGFKPVVIFDHCCWGTTGNVNCSISENPDIGDITRLIDYLFISRRSLCCEEEGNTAGEAGAPPDISDVMAIIDYLYLSHTPLRICP